MARVLELAAEGRLSDARFALADALAALERDTEHRIEGLRAEAARLEEHLRLSATAREVTPADLQRAEIVHAFELYIEGLLYTGCSIELHSHGRQLGRTLVAPPIKAGRYRAVLLLTALEDPPR